jgi:hypothetical protein
VNGKTGAVVLKAAEVEAVATSEVGQPDGVATLNGSGELLEAQLPSSVASSSAARSKGQGYLWNGSEWVPATIASAAAGATYPLEGFESLAAAIKYANEHGGGAVQLPAGGTPVSGTVQMKSRVILQGPPSEWSVSEYAGNPTLTQTAWLEPDESTETPVLEWGENVFDAGARNLMILGNVHRDGFYMANSTHRGGNRLRSVYSHKCKRGFYLGQDETRVVDIIAMSCASHGIVWVGEDGQMDGSVIAGYNGGHGILVEEAAAPLRCNAALDSFFNSLSGLVLNGEGNRFLLVQCNGNGQTGVTFLTATWSMIMHAIVKGNGLEYETTKGTRYPDVLFAHPTASNEGCGIHGGQIFGNNIASYGVEYAAKNTIPPMLIGIAFGGTYASAAGAAGMVRSYSSSFIIRGCYGVPDTVVPTNNVQGILLHKNGEGNQLQAQVTAGGENAAGITRSGALFGAPKSKSLKAEGEIKIEARETNFIAITLEANCTASAIDNPQTGQTLTIQWLQDGTGKRKYVWPSNWKFNKGETPAQGETANQSDIGTAVYNGANWIPIGPVQIGVH